MSEPINPLEISRYGYHSDGMENHSDGEYVLFSDHTHEMAKMAHALASAILEYRGYREEHARLVLERALAQERS
jgi:hypothetical protein